MTLDCIQREMRYSLSSSEKRQFKERTNDKGDDFPVFTWFPSFIFGERYPVWCASAAET
jgi:hypothetical protein